MAKEMYIEHSIIIDKPQSDVYSYLKHLKNQDQFSVWNRRDPNQKTTSQGVDGTVGYIYTWDSEVKGVGAGSQEIKKLVDNALIEYELRFERPMENVAQSKFVLEKIADNQTKVIWDYKSPTSFPISLFSGIFKRMLRKDMAKSLENLKAKLEQ